MASPFTKMVGPFPLVVWIGVGAAGIGIAYVINRGGTSVADGPPADDAGTPAAGTIPGTRLVWGGTPGAGPPSSDATPEPFTTDQWRILAIKDATASGVDALFASTALAKALAQSELSDAECRFVSEAITRRPPPYPLPPVVCLPAEPNPNTPPITSPVNEWDVAKMRTASDGTLLGMLGGSSWDAYEIKQNSTALVQELHSRGYGVTKPVPMAGARRYKAKADALGLSYDPAMLLDSSLAGRCQPGQVWDPLDKVCRQASTTQRTAALTIPAQALAVGAMAAVLPPPPVVRPATTEAPR